MGWRKEFGEDFEIPKWVEQHPDLVDMSWHNDEVPSFSTQTIAGQDPIGVRIWVDHVDPEQRDGLRFQMEFWNENGWLDESYDEICIIDTDDLALIQDLLPWAQGMISRYGRVIWNASARPFFWDKGCVFDPHGKPEKPGEPTDLAEAKSDEVGRALEAINLQRASIGMAKLDPASAGWRDQDILDEADRIRLKNGLLSM